MPDLRSLRLVVGREVREALRRKAVWIAAALALIGTTALMVLPYLVSSDDGRTIVVAGTAPPALARTLRAGGHAVGLDVQVEALANAAAARRAVHASHADLAILSVNPPKVVARSEDDSVVEVARQALALHHATTELRAAGVDRAGIASALRPPAVALHVIDSDRDTRFAVATIASLGVYLLLFMIMSSVANAVAIEKANHVSEVLLATVHPPALLIGKVIGVGVVGIIPFLAGAVPVAIKLASGGSLPPDTGAVLASSAVYFVVGSAVYLFSAAALGALVDRQEEVGSALTGLGVLLVGSYLVGQSAADSPVARVLAYVPFSAPMVEPARLALDVSSPLEVGVSLALAVVSVVVVARVGLVVYRKAIVRTGVRVHLREVLRPRSA
jgi:ABC-2 type transport system permease protein